MIHIPSFLDSFNALADAAGCSDMIQAEGGFQFKRLKLCSAASSYCSI